MKIFKIEEFAKRKVTKSDRPTILNEPQLVKDILTDADHARDLSGFFITYPPGTKGAYHYHKKCESLMVVVSGEGIEVVEGQEIPLQAGDVVYIPAGEKHTVINRSKNDFRFFEFHTSPPVRDDKFPVR